MCGRFLWLNIHNCPVRGSAGHGLRRAGEERGREREGRAQDFGYEFLNRGNLYHNTALEHNRRASARFALGKDGQLALCVVIMFMPPSGGSAVKTALPTRC